jgi:hypothetical protein
MDRPIDIQTLTPTVGFKFFYLPLLNSAVRWNAVVLRMSGIGEIYRKKISFMI